VLLVRQALLDMVEAQVLLVLPALKVQRVLLVLKVRRVLKVNPVLKGQKVLLVLLVLLVQMEPQVLPALAAAMAPRLTRAPRPQQCLARMLVCLELQ